MKVLPPVEEKLRRVIRDARAADPLITVSGLEHVLEKHFQRGFSRRYIAKLADKVHRAALVDADRTQLRERLNVTREKFRLASERLLQIIHWEAEPPKENETLADYLKSIKPPDNEDVIEASKNFAMMDLALLKAEIECGLYRDSTSDNASTGVTVLPDDATRSITTAFAKWGLIVPRGAVAQLTERTMTLHAPTTDNTPTAG